MTSEEMKNWIDNASYKELLYMWRFEPVGSPFFIGEMGDYYARKLNQKREEVGAEEAVKASKSIGWQK